MHISVYVPLWFWVRVCSWSCSLVARGLQAGRHFQDSKTQPAGLAPGSERWALKFLAFGGGEMKPVAPKFCFFLFFCPPPRPPTRILWFRDLGFLFFALYALRARHIPGRSFQLRLHSLYYWFHTIYSMDFCGPHKNFFYIHQVDIRFLWNLCSQCETESRKTRACSVLFSVYIYTHIYMHMIALMYIACLSVSVCLQVVCVEDVFDSCLWGCFCVGAYLPT